MAECRTAVLLKARQDNIPERHTRQREVSQRSGSSSAVANQRKERELLMHRLWVMGVVINLIDHVILMVRARAKNT
jgi:hypothetical protein